MRKMLTILALAATILGCGSAVEARQTKKKGKANTSRSASSKVMKSDVITGDFDGDGKIDKLWYEAPCNSDGFAEGKIRICSDNPKLAFTYGDGPAGLAMEVLGKLGGVDRDLLQIIPYGEAGCWNLVETYVFKNGKWQSAVEPFDLWSCDEENPYGVVKAKSGRDGYVGIYYNDMDADEDEMYERQYKEERINF